MLNFYLPNFYEKYNLNMSLIKDIQEYPYQYNENIKISAIYGTFPNAIWNGGRDSVGTMSSNIEETINDFNNLNIPIRFTFTNCLLEEHHLYNEYCNIIMEKANNGMNEVIVNSPILESYLRKNYPNFKYISSTTKCITNPEEAIKESEKYYLTVLDYRFNNNFDFLFSLKNKEKYELLINPYCSPCCAKRLDHYKQLSQFQLNGIIDYSNYKPCKAELINFYDIQEYPTFITNNDLYNKYAENGFSHFKIEGRSNFLEDVLESYIYYLVKPEYQNIVRLRLLLQTRN